MIQRREGKDDVKSACLLRSGVHTCATMVRTCPSWVRYREPTTKHQGQGHASAAAVYGITELHA